MIRKVFFTILTTICILACSCSALAELDLSTMSDDELTALIADAQQELNSRKATDETEQPVLYDDNGIKWYITGYDMSSWSSYLTIDCVVENESNVDITLSVDTLTVNGWDVSSWFYAQVSAGKKTKEELSFDLEDANISGVDEITSMEAAFKIYNSNTYNDIDEQHITFCPVF